MHKSELLITPRHYLILAVIAFAAGIFSFITFRADIFFSVALFSATVFVILGILLLLSCITKSAKVRRKKHLLLPFFLLLCFFLGVFRVMCTEYLFPARLREYTGKSLWISGTIASAPVYNTKSFSYKFEFDAAKLGNEYIYPERMILYVPKIRGKDLREGDEIQCWIEVSEPYREKDSDFLDYYTHLRGQNIYIVGYTQNTNPVTLEKPFHPITAIQDFGIFVKRKTVLAVDKLVPKNTELAAILKGILVGDKTDFTDTLYENFSKSGLSHLVAVSGMHLSILFSIISVLFYRLHAHKKLAYVFAVPLVIIFASAAEFTPSICRSGIMLFTMITAMLFKQRYTPLTALFLSLGIILAVTPYALFSKSLILSFGATFGIMAYFSNVNKLLKHLLKLPNTSNIRINKGLSFFKKALTSSLAVSFSAFVGTAFFSVLFFGQLSWIQLFTNLWAIPVVTLVFWLGLFGCIFYYIAPTLTVAALYYPLRICLEIIYSTANFFSKDIFSLNFSNTTVTFVHFAIYAGIAYILYMSLRLFGDCQYKERKGRSTDRPKS